MTESRILEKMIHYREEQKKCMMEDTSVQHLFDETENQNRLLADENEEEHRFNSALSALLAENSWQLVTTRTGRYKVNFRKSLGYVDRVSILGIVLEDIRERYYDLKANLQQSKRKYGRLRWKRMKKNDKTKRKDKQLEQRNRQRGS